jgi:glutathione synthase/RimK-type ligase-like ATP-grasp enzyme
MKPLRIAILAQLDSPTITEQLAPLLRTRGHTVDILDLSTMPYKHLATEPAVQVLAAYDLIYYRSGLDYNGESIRVIQLESFLSNSEVKTVNLKYTQHPLAHSKTYETQHAEKNGLLIPKSVYDQTADYAAISAELGSPLISKTDYGTRGMGVHLVRSEEQFNAIQTQHDDMPLLHQAFIKHDFEYRVHTLGGKMIVPDDIHTDRLHELAKIAYRAFGFENFVVDFMLEKDTNQLYFTEINLNTGWGHTDLESTGIDMIAITADYFEELCA